MVKRKGLDIRSNWLHFNNALLEVSTTSPEKLQEILTLGSMAIKDAMETMYETTKRNNPGCEIYHPWLNTIKLSTYDEWDKVFLPEAMEVDGVYNSNNDYPFTMLRNEAQEYWLATTRSRAFVPRVPGRMRGWNAKHDGVWLQIKHREHFETDGVV